MDLSDRPTKRARRDAVHDAKCWAAHAWCYYAAADIAVQNARLHAIKAIVPYPREILAWLMCMQRRGRSFPLWGQLHLRRNIGACFLDPETGGPACA